MIKHILHLIWNQRKSNSWLFAELLLISVSLWYIIDYFLVVVMLSTAPLGFDTTHTYRFQFNAREEGAEGYIASEENTQNIGKEVLEALSRIRRMPYVESAALSYMALPYNQYFNTMYLSPDSTTKGVSCYTFYVTPDYFEVYRIPEAPGSHRSLKEGLADGGIVLTHDAALALFENGEAIGQPLYNQTSWPKKVGAVSRTARNSEFERASARVYLSFSMDQIENFPALQLPWLDVSVRVKPDTPADFPDRFMRENSEQLTLGNLYLQNITPLETIRDNILRPDRSKINTRLSILFFLLINIFLGIVGTFWFRTRSRLGEMGLRMALGSTGGGLRKLMIGEGLLLLTVSFIPAVAICLNIALADLIDTKQVDNTPWRFAAGVGITYLLTATLVIAGIWYPAREAARLEPAKALHEE